MRSIEEINNQIQRARTARNQDGLDDRGDGWIDGYTTALEWVLELESTQQMTLSSALAEFND